MKRRVHWAPRVPAFLRWSLVAFFIWFGIQKFTPYNDFVAEVHDRMPVLLTEKDFEPWLTGAAGIELLKPAAEDVLQRWPVSKRVNSSKAPADDLR
jgi:hypothetical protein